jgi:hypothetical protein
VSAIQRPFSLSPGMMVAQVARTANRASRYTLAVRDLVVYLDHLQ